jgi:flagellar assembly protein FliH
MADCAAASQGETASPPAAPSPDPEVVAQRASLAMARTALESAAAQLRALQAEIVRESEHQLLDMAIDIARKVLMQEIQAQRYEIDPIVKEALSRIGPRREVVVHLNPGDLKRCIQARVQDGEPSGSALRLAEIGEVQFVADPSVQPAHCRIETPEGTVESTPEAHLERLALALAE